MVVAADHRRSRTHLARISRRISSFESVCGDSFALCLERVETDESPPE